MGKKDMSHSSIKEHFADNISSFYDLNIETLSLHGHRHFTTWEWTLTYKVAVDPQGERLTAQDATLKEVIGSTLMWWNDRNKIIRNHEYGQIKE